VLTVADRERYAHLRKSSKDIDEAERSMQGEPWYRHVRTALYPRLRTVNVDFFLHRKGMVKDTVHTTVVDSVYARGVQAIRDRDYATAVKLIGRYGDYNAAVAHALCDHNRTAMEILKPMERTAKVNYLLAILHSRLGNERRAVECYVRACSQDGSYVHRGNLDPEVSVLIRRFRLNERKEDL